MIEEPQITESTEQPAGVIHLTVPRYQMLEAFTSAVHELMDVLEDRGVEPRGSDFAHHLEIDPEVFDFEVGVPVAEEIGEEGRVKPGRLSAATVARTVYKGPYDGLRDARSSTSGRSRARHIGSLVPKSTTTFGAGNSSERCGLPASSTGVQGALPKASKSS